MSGLERERELFERAVAMDPGDRATFLERECRGDAALRARLNALLSAHSRAGAFMEDPTVRAGSPGQPTLGPAPRSASGLPAGLTRVAGFTLLRLIGEGGMGAVYLARQDKPEREVALKVIRSGFSSPSLRRRFELEAEVLGRLQHPGIAQVYEAGMFDTPEGPRPYFAMEYIRGEPLDTFVARRRPGTRDRLALAAKICDAVQHAHQKAIIHRDLKPGNILVTDEGDPKILDFGVARATDSDLRATTVGTDIGQLIGTVPYMSPEQVSGDPNQLDTRSDVYALGVVIYELLAGKLPYDLEKKLLHEAVRVIREDEPTRLSNISRVFRGDIETIVAKAMEKDKARRYQSANALAMDIRRYLSDEPIAARPASTWYQFRKFAKRNKGLVAGVSAAFVLLLAGIGGTSAGLLRANAALEREGDALKAERAASKLAQDNEAKAQRQATRSNRVVEILKKTLASAGPGVAAGRDATLLREVMDQTIRGLSQSLAREPEIEAEIRLIAGRTYADIGDSAKGQEQLTLAVSMFRSLGEASRLGLADALEVHADLLLSNENVGAAEPLVEEARTIRLALQGTDHPSIATNTEYLGAIAYRRGDFAKAERLFNEAIGLQRRLGPEREDALATTLSNLGILLDAAGRPEEAVNVHRESVDIHMRLRGEVDTYTANNLANLADSLRRSGNLGEAMSTLQRTLAAHRKLYGEEHRNVAIDLNKIASVHEELREFERTIELYEQSEAMFRRLYEEDNPLVLTATGNLGLCLAKKGDYEEALPRLEWVAARDRASGQVSPGAGLRIMNVAETLRRMKRLPESLARFREACEMYARAAPSSFLNVRPAISLSGALRESAESPELPPERRLEFLDEASRILGRQWGAIDGYADADPARRTVLKRSVAEATVAVLQLRASIQPSEQAERDLREWRDRLASLPPAQPGR